VGRRAGLDRKQQFAAAEEVDFDAFIIKARRSRLSAAGFTNFAASCPTVSNLAPFAS
jgi:hypothetical protein